VKKQAEVSPEVVAKIGLVCLGLPEAYEEPAWVGTRWCVAKKNFAHVLRIDEGWPPAYARAAQSKGPLTVLTFRAPLAKLRELRFTRPPFFRPVWFPNIAGLAIDDRVDWDEVGDLLVESYCVLAPKKLVELVDRPGG
jgi:hypothetical protein